MAHCPFCLWEESMLACYDDITVCDVHQEDYQEALEFFKEWPL